MQVAVLFYGNEGNAVHIHTLPKKFKKGTQTEKIEEYLTETLNYSLSNIDWCSSGQNDEMEVCYDPET